MESDRAYLRLLLSSEGMDFNRRRSHPVRFSRESTTDEHHLASCDSISHFCSCILTPFIFPPYMRRQSSLIISWLGPWVADFGIHVPFHRKVKKEPSCLTAYFSHSCNCSIYQLLDLPKSLPPKIWRIHIISEPKTSQPGPLLTRNRKVIHEMIGLIQMRRYSCRKLSPQLG